MYTHTHTHIIHRKHTLYIYMHVHAARRTYYYYMKMLTRTQEASKIQAKFGVFKIPVECRAAVEVVRLQQRGLPPPYPR